MHEKYIKAGHPATDIEDLRLLAKDDIDNVRRRVAENAKTPADVLTVLSTDEHPEVRIAVAENVGTPSHLLAVLVRDDHTDVRYALAENPLLAVELLVQLSEDENPYVSHRAMKTLRILHPIEPTTMKPSGKEENQQDRKSM